VRGKQLNVLGFSNFGTPREVMNREYLRLLELVRSGEIEVEVETYPFERAAEAWERQADGAGVKVVVTL
jgi:threonine dehydrogenase-like Zn-dependent dehydrogenase